MDAHTDGTGHDLFHGFRYIAVIKALQDHKGTYLLSPAWSRVPFSLHPKDIHDRLLDVLATGASFLGESDRLASTPPERILPALLHLDDRCRELNALLEAIYAELEREHEGKAVYWAAEPTLGPLDDDYHTRTDDEEKQSKLDIPLHFPSHEAARLLTLYWAQQTLLRMGRTEIRVALTAISQTLAANPLPIPPDLKQRLTSSLAHPTLPLLESARLVLRSRDYCCSSESAILRFSVPLNITLDVLALKPEAHAAEIKVAKEVKKRISERTLRITRWTGTLKYRVEI